VNGIPVSHFKGDFATSMNLVANLAAARDNGPFSPGPDEHTVFPNEFLVDYIRVWKPLNDPTEKNSEKWQAPKKRNPVISANSSSRIKRKVWHIYSRKRLKNENGFISLIPQSEFVYAVEYNGDLTKDLIVEVVDQKNMVNRMSILANTIDFSNYSRGNYLLKIQIGDVKTQVTIKI
jgi:hypothetical protein